MTSPIVYVMDSSLGPAVTAGFIADLQKFGVEEIQTIASIHELCQSACTREGCYLVCSAEEAHQTVVDQLAGVSMRGLLGMLLFCGPNESFYARWATQHRKIVFLSHNLKELRRAVVWVLAGGSFNTSGEAVAPFSCSGKPAADAVPIAPSQCAPSGAPLSVRHTWHPDGATVHALTALRTALEPRVPPPPPSLPPPCYHPCPRDGHLIQPSWLSEYHGEDSVPPVVPAPGPVTAATHSFNQNELALTQRLLAAELNSRPQQIGSATRSLPDGVACSASRCTMADRCDSVSTASSQRSSLVAGANNRFSVDSGTSFTSDVPGNGGAASEESEGYDLKAPPANSAPVTLDLMQLVALLEALKPPSSYSGI